MSCCVDSGRFAHAAGPAVSGGPLKSGVLLNGCSCENTGSNRLRRRRTFAPESKAENAGGSGNVQRACELRQIFLAAHVLTAEPSAQDRADASMTEENRGAPRVEVHQGAAAHPPRVRGPGAPARPQARRPTAAPSRPGREGAETVAHHPLSSTRLAVTADLIIRCRHDGTRRSAGAAHFVRARHWTGLSCLSGLSWLV